MRKKRADILQFGKKTKRREKKKIKKRGKCRQLRDAIFHVTRGPPSFACHQFNNLVKLIESQILGYFAHLPWYSTLVTRTYVHTHTHTITRRGKQRNSLLSTEKPVKTPPSPSSNFYSSRLN